MATFQIQAFLRVRCSIATLGTGSLQRGVLFSLSRIFTSLVWIRNDFVSDPTSFFPNILDINFTFVFLPCKCARSLIMTRFFSFFANFFFTKKSWVFLLKNCQILPFFVRVVLHQINFESWAARFRNDFSRIRILVKVLDATGPGSTTLICTSHFRGWYGRFFLFRHCGSVPNTY